MYIKIDDDLKRLVDEISAISGIQKEVIREVWEMTLIKWAEQITSNPEGLINLQVPFLGNIGVRYKGDTIEETGAVSTEVDAFVSLTPAFKKLIGDIVDEGDNIITDMLRKKIQRAITSMTTN